MNSLVEQVREKLDEQAENQADDFRLNQECTCEDDHFGTCWFNLTKEQQQRYGFKAGADSRTEMICRLVDVIEKMDSGYISTRRDLLDATSKAIAALKSDLGIGDEFPKIISDKNIPPDEIHAVTPDGERHVFKIKKDLGLG